MNLPDRIPTDFIRQVQADIAAHALPQPADGSLIVAVSGGADSVALLDVLVRLGYDCVAAHCNFHLRGDESMRDMHFVEQLAAKSGINLHVTDFDVAGRMRSTGESVEMACRALRYEWFTTLLDREHACAIAVGHHREDNAETLLLNLMRGTGIAGVCGMRFRNGLIIRPLLRRSRAEIESYLEQHGLTFVTDSTNASCDYRRNAIRNRILPAMEDCYPGAIDGLLRSMSCLADNRDVYESYIANAAARYRRGNTISLAALAADEPHARMVLFETLHPSGFSMSQVDDMLRSATSSGAKFISPRGATAELNRGTLTIYPAPEKADSTLYPVSLDADIATPVRIAVSRHDVARFAPERRGDTAYFDASLADSGIALTLRHPRRGDRMQPFGMSGSKLVSDILTAAKFTAAQKRSAWLLTAGDTVLWIAGVRASRHYAVTSSTRQYIQLQIIDNDSKTSWK